MIRKANQELWVIFFFRKNSLIQLYCIFNLLDLAKLYFNYSSMNAGKSTALLQASHNYQERGMDTLIITSQKDDRGGKGNITSRIGLSKKAEVFDENTNLFELFKTKSKIKKIACVLIDEAQFLKKKQIKQISTIVDDFDIPVLTFGIRTDFQGKLFEGSKYLLAWADNIKEIKTICWCGRKATMIVRVSEDGKIVEEGDQILIGGNETYISLCRKHFFSKSLG